MERETWVGLAWAGGLVVAMIGVFLYGAASYEPQRFDVVWAETEHGQTLPGDTLTVASAADAVHRFVIPGTNVTAVRITLDWNDPVGDNDAFEMEILRPGETSSEKDTARSGTPVAFALAEAPKIAEVEGANADHALEQIERTDDPWKGDGTWMVTVRLADAPGTPGTANLGVDGQTDGANDYAITFVHVTTDATLVRA